MPKVFISHSSKDKEIVDSFKNMILNAGLGIADSDIAYTSASETGVPTGGDIPKYIKENIAGSDFVFLMISENYRRSEVCLNEMGAAWALEKNVRPLVLPEISFDSVGWLYRTSLCARIDDADRLDELRDEFAAAFGSCPKTSVWNRQKAEFLSKIAPLGAAVVNPAEPEPESEELGLLDYKDLFDQNIDLFNSTMGTVTAGMKLLTEKTQTRTKQLSAVNGQHPNTSQVRGIMVHLAKDMDGMSESIEANAPRLTEHFDSAISAAIALQKCATVAPETKQENRASVNYLIQAILSAIDSTNRNKDTLETVPNLERTQIAAKKRLAKAYSSLVTVCENCLTRATELLKSC